MKLQEKKQYIPHIPEQKPKTNTKPLSGLKATEITSYASAELLEKYTRSPFSHYFNFKYMSRLN